MIETKICLIDDCCFRINDCFQQCKKSKAVPITTNTHFCILHKTTNSIKCMEEKHWVKENMVCTAH